MCQIVLVLLRLVDVSHGVGVVEADVSHGVGVVEAGVCVISCWCC